MVVRSVAVEAIIKVLLEPPDYERTDKLPMMMMIFFFF